MWTPKRILLLTSVFALLIVTFAVYAHFLPIDGLPQLPEKYMPCLEPPPIGHTEPGRDVVGEKLRQAFGQLCKESTNKYPIKLQLPARHMVLAAGDFNFEHDGRVRLSPVSIAIFGKPEPGKFPEINTVRAEVAYLTFDKPIYSAADMNSRKITKAELRGNTVEITNNRRTSKPDDDIVITINDGPLFYVETEHRLWTDKWVHLTDWLGSPQTTKVDAEGMDLYLATKQEPAYLGQPPKKSTSPSISGAERIVLRSSVTMTLYVGAGSGLMSPAKDTVSPERAPQRLDEKVGKEPATRPDTVLSESSDKDRVTIQTPGPFHYDMKKDFAQFDIPPRDPQHTSTYPWTVQVDRQHLLPPPEGAGKDKGFFLSKAQIGSILAASCLGPLPLSVATQIPTKCDYISDYLECEHLELQFRRKAAQSPQAHDDRTPDLEIETVHATGAPVVLASEGESLHAHGTDFFHNALTKMTRLKGDPKTLPNPVEIGGRVYGMCVMKEGNEIYGQEIELTNQEGSQQASARGPGCIRLLDKATGKRPLQASWNDSFLWAPDGAEDCLTLIGNGVFYDDEHGQYLRADTLKVWLLPADAKPAPGGPAPPVQNSRRPKRVEANGHVLAKSPEMHVHDTESLLIHFMDVPKVEASTKLAPPPSAVALPAKPASDGLATGKPPAPSPSAPSTQEKPPNPIDLSAQTVEATVLRGGEKNELDELRCVKAVRVIQKPATPEDNGVDIIGDKLHLTHFPEGNQLVVTGDLAQLRLDKIFIVGPEVNIDQVANKAWVNGIGAMQIENDSDFEGKKLPHPVPLTIHWNKRMMFNGPDAEFHGGIQATQENGRLMCQDLQVDLDRPVSLKEGNKDKQTAHVKRFVCDQKVNLHDVTMEGKKLIKDQRLEGSYLNVDNESNLAEAGGPGIVRIFQPGAPDLAAPPPAVGDRPKPAPAKPEEMKLTYVSYAGRMSANDKEKLAHFYDDVKVLHLPTDDPNLKIDLNKMVDNLPPNGMYLECKRLDVSNKQVNGKDNQELTARDNVFVKAQEFYGRAATVTYVENKDQVIFDGGNNGKGSAYLYRVRVKGGKPDVVEANKIIYLRKTGEFSVDGGKTFQGRN